MPTAAEFQLHLWQRWLADLDSVQDGESGWPEIHPGSAPGVPTSPMISTGIRAS